jgi:NAD+ kinase
MAKKKLSFVASSAFVAQNSLHVLEEQYGSVPMEEADVIVALGGDGFMLETLHNTQHLNIPVYGMNRGTVGFLMNAYSETDLHERLDAAEEAVIHPLRMIADCADGRTFEALAINEVSLLRHGPLVCTPAGSTAYNYSAHGPILPIGAEILALTAIAPFRPRRWRGALLPMAARVRIDVLEPEKRPVSAVADSKNAREVLAVEIFSAPDVEHRILFDPGHGLDERLIREQFA